MRKMARRGKSAPSIRSPFQMYLNGKVSRVPGIPIATDIEKGVYYVSRDGAVILALPDGTALVAADVKTFTGFVVVEGSEGDVQ